MPSTSVLCMHKAFCNSSSSFSSKSLISVPLLSHSLLSSFTFPPKSLLSQQLPGGISSQFLAHMCTSYFIPAFSSMTLCNLPFSQGFFQAASILDFSMWTLFYIPVATCPPSCLLKSQLIIISVIFLSRLSFPLYSLPVLAPNLPWLPPLCHRAASHSFSHFPPFLSHTTTQ